MNAKSVRWRLGSYAAAMLMLATAGASRAIAQASAGITSAPSSGKAWFRDAKFGMFIHWGIPVMPAAEWKGYNVNPLAAEPLWYMARHQIPVKDYERLAAKFNPTKFDARAWVRLAKDAGMKYVVVTAKHHDGFSMYATKVSPYNVVEATPFKRDPMNDLAEACRDEGVRFCFYYSQAQDWHHPDGGGNRWAYDEDKKDFDRYLEEKAKPQIRELLTNYGPIGLIWFDTPVHMTLARGQALVRLVHDIQPDCLVNSRVTGEEPNPGDYRSMGDNQFPAGRLDVPWETAGTLSASWSFREGEQNWKSPKHVIENLAANVSKGGNYLLNIGPTWEGVMPEPGAERLREVGRWLKVNGEAVYGAQPSPLRSPPDWGVITAKPGRLYLHVFDWPHKEIVLYGLRSKALKARLLADQTAVPVSQRHDPATDHHALILTLPTAAPDERDTVIAVETDGGPDVDAGLLQRPDGRIDLDAIHAKLDPRAANSRMHIAERGDGFVQGWLDSRDSVSWSVNVVRPGVFDVRIVTAKWSRKSGNDRVLDWEGGHAVVLSAGEERVSGVIEDNGVVSPPRFLRAEGVRSNLGRISIGKPGMCDITLRAERIERAKKLGFLLWRVVLIPASGS